MKNLVNELTDEEVLDLFSRVENWKYEGKYKEEDSSNRIHLTGEINIPFPDWFNESFEGHLANDFYLRMKKRFQEGSYSKSFNFEVLKKGKVILSKHYLGFKEMESYFKAERIYKYAEEEHKKLLKAQEKERLYKEEIKKRKEKTRQGELFKKLRDLI